MLVLILVSALAFSPASSQVSSLETFQVLTVVLVSAPLDILTMDLIHSTVSRLVELQPQIVSLNNKKEKKELC